MITAQEVRDELRDDQLTDEVINRTIERVKGFLVSYTNNPTLFEKDDFALDDVLLYVVCIRLNPDTRGRQGLTGENIGGTSYTYLNDLPEPFKRLLNKYRRANWR